MSYWGYHLILDVAGCDTTKISDQTFLTSWVKNLVNEIGMVAYGEPQVVHFGQDTLAGNTVVQLIETSNIVAHFVDTDGSLYLDVFSCKEFDPFVVLQDIRTNFNPSHISHRFFTRQALVDDAQ